MKLNSELRGTGTVFRYTMQQHYKTVSVQIFMLVLIVLALISVPAARLIGGYESEIASSDIKKLLLRNETPFAVTAEDIRADSRYAALAVEMTDLDNPGIAAKLKEDKSAVGASIAFDALGRFAIKGYYGETTEIDTADVMTLTHVLEDALHSAILRTANADEAQEKIMNCTAAAEMVYTAADYEAGKTEAVVNTDTHEFVNLAYSYFVLILCALAMSYIFQLCMEEKVSKLVEMLMVSIKPAALLAGKILAVTCFLLIGIAAIGGSLFASYQFAKATGDVSFISDVLKSTFGADTLDLGIGSLVLVFVCVMIAYFIGAFFSGIVGACCSKTEDTQQASLAVVLFLMVGYLTASLTPMLESDAVNIFLSIFPLSSMFTALPNFLCGKINLIVFLIGIAVQLVTIYGLARLAGAVYRMMLLYRGGIPSPKKLFRMLKENRSASKENAGKEAESHEA